MSPRGGGPGRSSPPACWPRPYTTIKGKCLDKTGAGLACAKAHAHDREIAACPDHPARDFTRSAARAAKL
eukprot:5068367-Alexandrium_andersonii.AAC.1